MAVQRILRRPSQADVLLVMYWQNVSQRTSGCGSAITGGDKGSLNSGIESWTGAVPFNALASLVSSGGSSRIVPFGGSELDRRP